MNELGYNLYTLTKDPDHLALAHYFHAEVEDLHKQHVDVYAGGAA